MAYDVRPTAGELEEARAVVEIALESVDRELSEGLQALNIGLGWSDSPVVTDAFGGAIAIADAADRVRVLFNAQVEDWTDGVMAATARGVGQAWLRAGLPDEQIAFQWQAVLVSAAGIRLAAAVAPSTPTPWAETDRLADSWPAMRAHLADSTQNEEVWSDPETPAYPIESLGACLGKETALSALPELTRSDVIERLEQVLGDP